MKRIIIFIILVLSVTAALFFPFLPAVVVEDGDTGNLLGFFRNLTGKNFSVKYIHSIHRSPVLETYQTNKKGEIVQTEMQFEEFGVGMPSSASKKEIFIQKDGTYILSNMNRTFSSLDVRVGQVIANHRFIIRGKEYPFSDFCEPGSWVRIKTDKLNVWQWVIGGNILGKQ